MHPRCFVCAATQGQQNRGARGAPPPPQFLTFARGRFKLIISCFAACYASPLPPPPPPPPRLYFCSTATAATLVLDSSVGTRGVCPGEIVTYTCTVTQGFLLEWIVEPFILDNTDIEFPSTDTIGRSFDCNNVAAVQCADLNFVATLTNTASMIMMGSTTLADITSTLTITAAVRLNGTVVQCRGSTAVGFPVVNNTLHVAGVSTVYILCYLAIVSWCLVTKTLHGTYQIIKSGCKVSIALYAVSFQCRFTLSSSDSLLHCSAIWSGQCDPHSAVADPTV